MKSTIISLFITTSLFFSVHAVSADDIVVPLVGEWTNRTGQAEIKQLKFFPNGLLTVTTLGNAWSTRYKITSNTATGSDIYWVSGYIKAGNVAHFADRDQHVQQGHGTRGVEDENMKFTAKITSHQKVMTLQIDNNGMARKFTLVKTNNIKTGAIPAN